MPQTDEEIKAAEEAAKAAAESVTIKKADLDKINSDLENYKKMGNTHKEAAEKWAAYEKAEAIKAEAAKSQNNQGQFDESKVSEVTKKTIREANQRTAQGIFFKNMPEEEKTAVLAELKLSGNELTVEELTDRLDAALLEHKRKTGKLDEYMQQQNERKRQQGFLEGQMQIGHQGGGAGDRNGGGQAPKLSEKGEEMAQRMHVDPKKAAAVDPKKDNVINIK